MASLLAIKNIIGSTKNNNYAIIVVIMSRTIRKYQIKDRRNRYKTNEKLDLKGRYYTDVAKSHDRKIKKKGLQEEDED